MSIYFYISAESAAEFDMLESEGAPEINMSNGAGMHVAHWFKTGEVFEEATGRGVPDPDTYAGRLDPEQALANWEYARASAEEWDFTQEPKLRLGENGAEWNYNYMVEKVEGVRRVLEAAQRLDRTVTWS